MANIVQLYGAETTLLSTNIEVVSSSATGGGAVAIEVSNVIEARGTLKCTTAGGSSSAYAYMRGITVSNGVPIDLALTNCYFSFVFRYSAPTGSGTCEILVVQDSTPAVKLRVWLTAGGLLKLYDSTGALIGTGTAYLAPGVRHLIEVHAPNGTSATATVKVNGVTDISGSGNFIATDTGRITMGQFANAAQHAMVTSLFYDNLVVASGTYPGAGFIALLEANAAGYHTAWSGSYADVDEPVPDSATYALSTLVSGDKFSVNCRALADVCSPASIQAVVATVHFLRDDAVNSGNIRFGLRVNGTDYMTTINATSSTIRVVRKMFLVNPNTGIAWTEAGVNATEVVIEERDTTYRTRVSTMAMHVVYTPNQIFDELPFAGGAI